jgi:hypothetical protein
MSRLFPNAIIFCNDDLTLITQNFLTQQLQLSVVMSGASFDALYAANPNYKQTLYQTNTRILVMRDLKDHTNRNVADVVLFIKGAIATHLKDGYGAPTQAYSLENLTWAKLGFNIL